MAAWVCYGLLVAAVAYLCGSIPTGYWLGRLLKGIDIRNYGSGSTGATNVLRTLGNVPAVAALLIDLMKGAAAVAFARSIYSLPAVAALTPYGVELETWRAWAMTIAALLAILGHSRSIWIRFTGGKSAATGLGVLLAMSWQVGVGVAIVFGIVLAASRIVSLSSISSAIAAVILMVVLDQPIAFLSMAMVGSVYVVWRHKANLHRLWAGTEPRIGQPT
jgi:acyl phosphate:glycerol-3-phosphate acyltransferase